MILFCSHCGEKIKHKVPNGDHKVRAVCDNCGFIDYQNPRIISCAIVRHQGKLLICKRNIEPRLGLWTIPGGFMENEETCAQAAKRETLEEAEAQCEIDQLIAVIDLPDYNQVHMFYTATMTSDHFAVTDESSEVELIELAQMPWSELAFRTVIRALQHYQQHVEADTIPVLEDTILANQQPTMVD